MSFDSAVDGQPVEIAFGGSHLQGALTVPVPAIGLAVMAHAHTVARRAPRHRALAQVLARSGIATLQLDLLLPGEEFDRRVRSDVALLAPRLATALARARQWPALFGLPHAIFASSTAAAAALDVAARPVSEVMSVATSSGRPDLLGEGVLARVAAPVLLMVDGTDIEAMTCNQQAARQLGGPCKLVEVPQATRGCDDADALERMAVLAADWFKRWFRV
jgi:hypothetical protein